MQTSNPITSKTMWALYSGQVALSLAFYQLARLPSSPADWLFAWALTLIALLPIIGVLGLVGLDRVIFAGVAVAEASNKISDPDSKGNLLRTLARLFGVGRGDAPKGLANGIQSPTTNPTPTSFSPEE